MSSSLSDGMPSRTATPIYQPSLSPALSHTYVNQYADSEYFDRDQRTRQLPYLSFEIDNGYEEINNQSHYRPSTGCVKKKCSEL